jgi:predicted ATPase
MRMKSITANNFKSLVNFKLDLAKFTCLIGLNGAGKSTVLQFVDFLAQQIHGDVRGWLVQRHWKPKDLHSKLSTRKNIDFGVEIVSDEGQEGVTWKASFNTTLLHCSQERIQTPGAILEVKDGHLRITDRMDGGRGDRIVFDQRISFEYEGSILSQLKESILVQFRPDLPYSLVGFKNYFSGIRSLDLLSPDYLRQRTRSSDGTLGLGGQRLSAYLYEIGDEKRTQLCDKLKRVYPQLDDLEAKSLRSGWKQMEIRETFGDRSFVSEARHVNDGMLRLIAILAELGSDHRFLLFDEIENGINPELVEFVIRALTEARQQVMVTTHSPMILNYLDDDTATSGVMYLYKTTAGYTRSVPFFSIPSLREKLTVMGPGEAFVDTNLTQLADEIEGLATERP